MQLLASTASYLLEKSVNPRRMSDDEIIRASEEQLPEEMLTDLRKRFGEDLKQPFNGHSFAELTRIYSYHAKDTEVFNRFKEYVDEKRKPETEEAAMHIAHQMFNQFIYAAREVASKFADLDIANSSTSDLALRRTYVDSVEREVPISTQILNFFEQNNQFMPDTLQDVFGSKDAASIITLRSVIKAAEIEKDYLKSYQKEAKIDQNMLRTMAGPLSEVPESMRTSPERALVYLLDEDPEVVANWAQDAKEIDVNVIDMVRAAIGLVYEIPDREETQWRVDQGEGRGNAG